MGTSGLDDGVIIADKSVAGQCFTIRMGGLENFT
jgi:hypothetical protein